MGQTVKTMVWESFGPRGYGRARQVERRPAVQVRDCRPRRSRPAPRRRTRGSGRRSAAYCRRSGRRELARSASAYAGSALQRVEDRAVGGGPRRAQRGRSGDRAAGSAPKHVSATVAPPVRMSSCRRVREPGTPRSVLPSGSDTASGFAPDLCGGSCGPARGGSTVPGGRPRKDRVMPASPALALRGRVRRLGAGVCACALAALALAPAASAADREITVSATAPAAWEGRAALGVGAVRPGHADPVRQLARATCATRRSCTSTAPGRWRSSLLRSTGTGDVDLYVHRSDAFGLAGPPVAVSAGDGADERVRRPGRERQLPGPRRLVRRPARPGSPGRAALAPRARRRSRTSTIPAAVRRSSSATRATAPPHSPRWPSARAIATCSSRPIASSPTTRT